MAALHLITGGARSGKSAYAEALAEALPGPRLYVATCPVLDGEMAERIRRHRARRAGRGWETAETPRDPARAIRDAADVSVVLLDCLTLWINNLLFDEEGGETGLDEDAVALRAGELVDACRAHPGRVFVVTNEVGLGIVPDTSLARRFRDLAGRCNQVVAAGADEVTLMVSGVPFPLKPTKGDP